MYFYSSVPHKKIEAIAQRLRSPFAGERDNAARAIGRVLASCRFPHAEIALGYAEKRGWTVFPAPRNRKKGLKAKRYSGGRNWGATRDLVEIATDWLRWPWANIGVVCGPLSGIWVLEIDIKPGVDGAASLAWLEELNSPLPDTLMAASPSGSIHRYFRWPDDGGDIRNSASRLGRGVDVRAAGGMVIAPPSLRKGKHYRWLNNLPVAEAPAWLIGLARQASTMTMPRGATPNPAGAFDAEGLRQDGREGFMAAVVWREVLQWRRERGRLPEPHEWQARAAAAIETYEQAVATRVTGAEKRDGLEKEGRGTSAFWEKWRRAMAQWDSAKVKAAAAAGPPTAGFDLDLDLGSLVRTRKPAAARPRERAKRLQGLGARAMSRAIKAALEAGR